MSEKVIQNCVRIAAARMGMVLLRNNCGTLQDRQGRYVTYGVGNPGGADLVGWWSKNGVAVFVAVEVKIPGKKPTQAQANFLLAVNNAGGIGICVHSVEEFTELLKERMP